MLLPTAPRNEGVVFTAICDCCHSENLFDHQKVELDIPYEKPPSSSPSSGPTHQLSVNGQLLDLPPEVMAVVASGQFSGQALWNMINGAREGGMEAKVRAISEEDLGVLLNTNGTPEGLM